MTIGGATQYLLSGLLALVLLQISFCQSQGCDQLRLTSECACEGSMVMYECAVTGGVSTQWQISTCEITLQQLDIAGGTAEGDCLNGQIIGRGIRNNSNCYVSSLTIDLTSDLINETVRCLVDDGLQTHLIDNATITTIDITEPAPQNLRQVENWAPEELVVAWDSVLENCSDVYYNIISTELCGVCPSTVTQNMVICTNFTESGLCNITVETVGCNINDGRERTSDISVMISVEMPTMTQSSEDRGNLLSNSEIAAIVVVLAILPAAVVLGAVIAGVIVIKRAQAQAQIPRRKRLDDQGKKSKQNSSRDEGIGSPLIEENQATALPVVTDQAGDTFQRHEPKGTGEQPVSKRYSRLLLDPTEEELGGESDVKTPDEEDGDDHKEDSAEQETRLDDQGEDSKRNSSRDEGIGSPPTEENQANAPSMFIDQAGDTFQQREPKDTGERPVSKRYSLLLLNPTEEELGGESDVKEKLVEVDDKLTKVEETKSENEPIKIYKELIYKQDKTITDLVNERRELKKKLEDCRSRLAAAEKRSEDRAEDHKKMKEMIDSLQVTQETMERDRSKSISEMKEVQQKNEKLLQNEIKELKTQISAITPLLNAVIEQLHK